MKKGFQRGYVSKEGYTLLGHQAAVDGTKSEQREAAEADLDYCALLNYTTSRFEASSR